MKIIEYKTATAGNWVTLDGEVNKMLLQGFQLYGSPYCAEEISGAFMLAQAMVKCGLRDAPVPIETVPTTVITP